MGSSPTRTDIAPGAHLPEPIFRRSYSRAVAGFVPGSLGVPEGGGGAAPLQVPEPNAEAAARLTDMGFPEAVARRALLLTRNRLDAATEWCLLSRLPMGFTHPTHENFKT